MSRYEDNPFLRLVDCYILDAIGELGSDQREILIALEPKLRQTFNSSGTWQEMVKAEMDFAETVPEKLRSFWAGYIEAAKAQGLPALPDDFVTEFVKQNFPQLTAPGSNLH